jgi:hypothetical protein
MGQWMNGVECDKNGLVECKVQACYGPSHARCIVKYEPKLLTAFRSERSDDRDVPIELSRCRHGAARAAALSVGALDRGFQHNT